MGLERLKSGWGQAGRHHRRLLRRQRRQRRVDLAHRSQSQLLQRRPIDSRCAGHGRALCRSCGLLILRRRRVAGPAPAPRPPLLRHTALGHALPRACPRTRASLGHDPPPPPPCARDAPSYTSSAYPPPARDSGSSGHCQSLLTLWRLPLVRPGAHLVTGLLARQHSLGYIAPAMHE